MFDLSDHTLQTISTWIAVAVFIFMLGESAERRFRARSTIKTAAASRGFWTSVRANRNPIIAIISLAIVIWIHWGRGDGESDRLRAEVAADRVALASNQRSTDALRAQLVETQNELDTSKARLKSSDNLTFVQRYFENDFVHFVNIYFVGEVIVRQLDSTNTALLITASPETQPLADYIYEFVDNTVTILRSDQQRPDIKDPTVRPPKDTDLDAPKLSPPDFNGIAVYGVVDERTQQILADMFNRIKSCFIVRYSQHTPPEITDYYKRPIIWIDIGHMPLWKERPRGVVGRVPCNG